MKETLLEQYNIKIEKTVNAFGFEGVLYRNLLYCIVPIPNWELEEIIDLKQMSDYLYQKGDFRIATILPTLNGELSCKIQDKDCIIVRCPTLQYSRTESIGRELAKYHKKGRSFPYQLKRANRIGQWKYLWEKRLDQMELFWRGKVQQHPANTFETLFVESFPYYIGLTENAIQYLVDTELDESPTQVDSATICHHRFTTIPTTRFPTDIVLDHCTRDVAEYIRHLYHTNHNPMYNHISEFIGDYERVTPLSPFSWRLLYSRLLFPLHYFECIERYYMSDTEGEMKSQEKQLKAILEDSSRYEKFLASFFERIGVQSRNLELPEVSWLSK